MTQALLSTSNATEEVSPMAAVAEVLLGCLQNELHARSGLASFYTGTIEIK